MKIKIAVCDDENIVLKQIGDYLKEIENEISDEFSVFYFSSGDQLIDFIPSDTHILLLDISMSTVSGIDAAKTLRSRGFDFYLFFITGNVQYALEGYEVHAYAFLQKPLNYGLFKHYLLETIDKIKKNRPLMLNLRSGSDILLVESDSIIYAEVYGHYTYIVSETDKREYSVSLSELEKKLVPRGFFRCHKSYLINLKKIKGIRAMEVIMQGDYTVPLSKYRKAEFLAAFNSVVG